MGSGPVGVLGVYPRVCGGTDYIRVFGLGGQGLSPRVRGNRGLPVPASRRARSIPACAGEPEVSFLWASQVPVYPRVCGGTSEGERAYLLAEGLSPRVRGNRVARAAVRVSAPVYPRVCGGTVYACNCAPSAGGLSPRVRGNRRHVRRQAAESGSIPACAGEPPSRRRTGP